MTDHVSEYVRKASEKAKSSPSPLREPGKRWANKYMATDDYFSSSSGRVLKNGEVVWGRGIYPSRDICETRGFESD